VAHAVRFLVSPVTDAAVIRRATELGVASIPGGHTPTELLAAHRAGAPLVKLFPAPAGGPAWLRSLLAPLPFLKVVPTNGVDQDNARQWLDAGPARLVARSSNPTTRPGASTASRNGRGRSCGACARARRRRGLASGGHQLDLEPSARACR
jgi:2-keto-3-deoxy-6-phosphogluconate aldolase